MDDILKFIDHQKVHELYVDGMSVEEITTMFGIHKKTTMRILKSYGSNFKRVYFKIEVQTAILALQSFYNENNSLSAYMYRRLQYKPSVTTIKNLFGTWENAVFQAGFNTSEIKETLDPERKIYTKDEIINLMKIHLSKDRSIIKRKVYIEKTYEPSIDIVLSHFGSWRNMLLELGLDINTKSLK